MPICSHNFSEIYLHLNWHCKDDRPLIRPEIEPILHTFLLDYCRGTKGIHEAVCGGTADHIHLAFRMEPIVTLSGFIGDIKGASSHAVNQRFGKGMLYWQRGFGIVSFAKQHLPGIVSYVRDQKKHHQEGTTKPKLEEHGNGEEEDG